MKRKTITATVHDTLSTVRISVPSEFADEPTVGHRNLDTGIIRIGYYVGRKWLVVQDYSIWVDRYGSCKGATYTAYDLSEDLEFAQEIFSRRHYTDVVCGREPGW